MDKTLFFAKKFVRRITKDFQYKELLPLKLLFFVHASTIFVLYPYLTIHMRELGINVEETAIMSAVTPVVAIIMPPIAGMIADKIGNFKILLSIFSALGGGAALLLLLVPVGRLTVTYPERLVMDVGCSGNIRNIVGGSVPEQLNFNLVENEPCEQLHIFNDPKKLKNIDTRLESCGFVCQPFENSNAADLQRVMSARSYDVSLVRSSSKNVTDIFSYKLSSEDMPVVITDDLRNHRMVAHNEHYQTSIRNLTKFLYFFPTTGLYSMDCVPGNDSRDYECSFGMNGDVREGVSSLPLSKRMFGVNLMQLQGVKDGSSSSKRRKQFLSSTIDHWPVLEAASGEGKPLTRPGLVNATCRDIYSENEETVLVSVPLRNPDSIDEVEKTVSMGNCQPRCLVTLPRKQMCSNFKAIVEIDPNLTFWIYLIIRVFIGVIGGTAFAMFEGAVIAILREHNADYGLQRIYATIGGMISSPLSGMMIDYASQGKGYTDFRPAFYLYAFLKIASAFLMLTINLEFKSPATNVVRDVIAVLKNAEIIALFVAVFILGTAWGYLESFLFWLLQDLGASRSLMGITITVGGVAGIPLLVLSGPIINRIGHANVLFIGFIFYAIRLTGYSLIYNPWLCLIFEAMESVTSSLSFTAAVTYAAKLSTLTTDTSIQGLLGGLYYGVGKGAGSLVGGYLMKGFGTRETYRIFAVMCLITGTIYFLFNKFFLRKRPMREGNEIVKRKPKKVIGDAVEIDLGTMKPVHHPDKANGTDNKNEILPINQSAKKTYGNTVNETNNSKPFGDTKSTEGNENDVKDSAEMEKPSNGANSCSVNLGFVDDADNPVENHQGGDKRALHTGDEGIEKSEGKSSEDKEQDSKISESEVSRN